MRSGITRIAAGHPDQLVAAFVHGGVIGQVMNIAAGTSGFGFTGADNASIHHIVVDQDRWVVRCFNDTSHLSPTFSAPANPSPDPTPHPIPRPAPTPPPPPRTAGGLNRLGVHRWTGGGFNRLGVRWDGWWI